MNALDTRFGALVDAWDGAKIQLATTEKQLAVNRAQLSVAQKQSLIAQRRAAQLLVTIYEGDTPDLIQLLVGSSKLSDVINAVQYTRDVASAEQHIAAAAVRARDRLTAATERLQNAERSRRATLAQLDGERATIGAMLTKRRQLLSSIQSQIVEMKAQEAAQQARAAAAARARLARQEAQLREEAAQRAKDAAAAAAAAAAQAKPSPTANTTPVAPPTAATTTTSVTTTTAATAPTTTPTVVPVSGGHPEAASIALKYLGIPYQWGGASPGTGFDCSGLVMYVFAQLGVQLPHFAAGQYGYGSPGLPRSAAAGRSRVLRRAQPRRDLHRQRADGARAADGRRRQDHCDLGLRQPLRRGQADLGSKLANLVRLRRIRFRSPLVDSDSPGERESSSRLRVVRL